MESNLVSVVIPVYNVEDYISSCLDSVLSQSYTKIEVIIVDDGSEDNSGMICDEYAERDKRVKVLHTMNKGVSEARNLALSKVNGEWVTFVDADDIITPNTIQSFISIAEKGKLDVVIGGIQFDLNPIASKVFLDKQQNKIYKSELSEEFLCDLIKNLKMSFGGKLYSRKILDGLKFSGNISNYEDYILLWKLAHKRPAYATINHIGYIARCRAGSASRTYDGLATYRKRVCSLVYACNNLGLLFKEFPKIRRNLSRFVIDEGLGCRALYGSFRAEEENEVVQLTSDLWNSMRSSCVLPWFMSLLLKTRVNSLENHINEFPFFQYYSIRLALRFM